MIGAAGRRARSLVRASLGGVLARRQPSRVDPPLSTWGLRVGPSGSLFSGDIDLSALTAEHGTPFHLVTGDRLDANAAAALGRGADIFVSYKTNPVPEVLARLHRSGIGAEVISPYELWLAMRLGVPGDRLIYNGPAKSARSIRDAIHHGVLAINANSVSEASLIARIAADERRIVNLGLRLAVPGAWAGQFGIGSMSAAVGAVRAALEHPWVSLVGVHAHRGSSIRTTAAMSEHLSSVTGLVGQLRAATGWSPSIIDVGGSLACPTTAPIPAREFRFNRALGTDLLPPDATATLSIGAAAELAARIVGDEARAAGVDVPRVVLEPGRALMGDTQMLLTSVVDVNDGGSLPHAVVDAGINLAEPLPNEYHHLLSVSSPCSPATIGYRIAGPICTPADVIYNHWRLPPLTPGHVLAIMDTGAYFVAFSTTFSFPKPPILMQERQTVRVVRRRETFDDMTSFDVQL
jgi:diaminopimelate decarboxylase